MEPEAITSLPKGNKNRILFIAVALLLVGSVAGYWYLFMQKNTIAPVDVAPVVQKNKISSADFSKLQILQDLMAEAPTDHVSETEKLRILKNLQTKAPATKASDVEKLRILQGLAFQ